MQNAYYMKQRMATKGLVHLGFLLLLLAATAKITSTEVTFLKTEIKRNNISLPLAMLRTSPKNISVLNATTNNNAKGHSAPKDKGEKKSEVYVVNNGLLLLHPKKVVTTSGVKKSVEPVPPLINYHVIKKVHSNATKTVGPIQGAAQSHLKKRSLSKGHAHKKSRSFGQEVLRAARRLEGQTLRHRPNIPSSGKQRIGTYTHHPSNLKRTFITSENIRGNEMENPLFDNEQEPNLSHVTRSNSIKRKGVVSPAKRNRAINRIKKIPDIRKYFLRPEQMGEYPRFNILPFEGHEYPRFPIEPVNALIYPRFPVGSEETQILHRYPIKHAELAKYPRYPNLVPVKEFPRSATGMKRFVEYPRFEEIKPLNLDEMPRFPAFPEATPIPEIKSIGDSDKKGGAIPGVQKTKRHLIAGVSELVRVGANEEENDYDDGDDDENEEDDGAREDEGAQEDEGAHEDDDDARVEDEDATNNWYNTKEAGISSIGHIRQIPSPPNIPDIQDIPFLPDIPEIHSIKPLASIKPLPPADKAGLLKNQPNDKSAEIESSNVSVHNLVDGETN